MAFRAIIGRWFNHAANAATFWTLAPAGALAVIGGILSQGVSWIEAFGPFGWFVSGLLVFFISAVALGLLARTKLWRIEAKRAAKLVGDSSPFDPMARVYENKRLFLRDLAPLGRRMVIGKSFINCEIIGPGTIVLGLPLHGKTDTGTFRDCKTFDVDCIEIDPAKVSQLAVAFRGCDFDNCDFYHLTLLWIARTNESLHWITPGPKKPLKLEAKGE